MLIFTITVKYILIQHMVQQREIYEKTTEQKLQNMEYFKNTGNQYYSNNKIDDALYFYQKVIIYGDYTFPKQGIQIMQMELLLQQANLNAAICCIKKNQWNKSTTFLRQTVKYGSAQTKMNSQINSSISASNNQKNEINKMCTSKLNSLKKGYYWYVKFYINSVDFQRANQLIDKLKQLSSSIQSPPQVQQLQKQMAVAKQKNKKQQKQLSRKMLVDGAM